MSHILTDTYGKNLTEMSKITRSGISGLAKGLFDLYSKVDFS